LIYNNLQGCPEKVRKTGKGFKPKIKSMVWQQGEGDARDIADMKTP
jgi:hypothetical protein